VLFEKNADERIHPASMSKLMTIYMLFEQLAGGTVKLFDTFPVSQKAWRTQGSKMFVKVGTRVPLSELLKGIIIQSGNDACIVVAEGLASSEAEFARQMTQRGKELGLLHSTFVNATGWPDPGHEMSVHDIALLATHIIRDFPQYYHLFSETTFTYNDIKQGNRNPLLYDYPGADGVKTGFDCELTAAVSRATLIPVIASGGAGKPEDFLKVLTEGEADAALAASIFHFGTYTVDDLKEYLDKYGIVVRRRR